MSQSPDSAPVSDASSPAISDSEKKTILYLNHSAQMSGAEASLRGLLRGLRQIDAPFEPLVALPGDGPFASELREKGWSVSFAPLRRLQRPRGIIDGMASLLHVLQTAPHICRLVDKSGAAPNSLQLDDGAFGRRRGRRTHQSSGAVALP